MYKINLILTCIILKLIFVSFKILFSRVKITNEMEEETEILKSIYFDDIVKCELEWYLKFLFSCR